MPRGRKRLRPDDLDCPVVDTTSNSMPGVSSSIADSQFIDSKLKFNKMRKFAKDVEPAASISSFGSGADDNRFDCGRLISWFQKYTTKNPNLIEPEGIESFCHDIRVHPEDIVMLFVAYKMNAKQMGYFTRDEWFRLMVPLQCDTLHKFLPKIHYFRIMIEDKAVFKELFRFAFDFSKDHYQRTIDIATGSQMLQLLLADKWPLLAEFLLFLNTFEYKAINRDQWCNVLEFSRNILPDLSNYDFDGAWPVVLDEFVEWLSTKNHDNNAS